MRSVAINYVSETKNYLEKYFTLSALRTLIKYIVRPIVPFPCALIMGHAKTKQQYADKVSLECLPNVSPRLERKGKKRSPLNPFNRPQTRTNRQVSKNRRLTGGTTPCPRRDKGARAIRLVGKDQKEGRKEEVKILFFPYRTVLSVFRAATLPTGGEPIHLWATYATSLFPPLANERNRREGGKREGTVPLASPPSLVGRARLSIKFRGTGNIFRSSHAR